MSGLQVRLIRERRDYYWNWSEDEGWQSQFDQKDLIENEQTLDLKADETGKGQFSGRVGRLSSGSQSAE